MTHAPAPMPSSAAPWPEGAPRAGQTIGDKYVCERILGAGGMGVVLAARHAQLGQQVAIKVLLPAALKDPAAAERFLREARAAIAIKSDHVARVMDFGTWDTGAPYLVMEHLEGSDLKDLLNREGPLPVASVADYAIQACEALFEAHRRGIVHRDLKPANLFVTTRVDGTPHVKILDFGISKTVAMASAQTGSGSGSGPSITKTDAVFGTPAYMSPEQLRSSKQVDHRTDLWSMGVSLYELLAGRLPFGAPGDGVLTVVAHILEDSPKKLTALRSDVPLGLQESIERCLAKDPADRFQSAADLAEALAPFASPHSAETLARIARMSVDSLPFETTVRSDSGALSGRPPPPLSSGWGRTSGRTGSRKRSYALAIIVGVVIAGAVATGWVMGARSGSRPSASAVPAAQSSTAPTLAAASVASEVTATDSAPAPPAPSDSMPVTPAPIPTRESAVPVARPGALPTAPKPEPSKSSAPEPAKCETGMVMSNGHCCRAGFEWKGGECVPGVAKGLR